ncbi:MAG: response regulator transcription factor [Dehalococcoidia bacterium]|nr:response regulator transcription factor [Dehalococcoidia bacterium]
MEKPTREKIKVLLVEDHAIVREGIRSLLNGHEDVEVVGEATDGSQALSKVRELRPDIVLMDITMPNMSGFEATRAIKSEFPNVQVLALTVHEGAEYFFRILSEGASGYVLKGASFAELVFALRAVHQGGVYLHPSVAGKLVHSYVHGSASGAERVSYDGLTTREREVLKLIGDGKTNQEIAEAMYLSPNTVQTHRARIMDKLGLHSRTQLIKYALSKGLIDATE